jgi:pimeloyl-ACP methyl ester carboxylesterase
MNSEQKIYLENLTLTGNLSIPNEPIGIVIFAHGSGSSRFSPRNRSVAELLNQHRIATLLTDLLTEKEEKIDEMSREFRFNIPLLAERLLQITDWLLQKKELKSLPIGYFGSSTGAAAALIAAAKKKEPISAVVSRGGRPDLAKLYLPQVVSPTLLIVGELDTEVIELNQDAYALLKCPKQIEMIPGAAHLFEEPGCLKKVANIAALWFTKYFQR